MSLAAVRVRSTSFAALRDEFTSPVCLISLDVANSRAGAVLAVDRTLAFPILEILMGGSGELSLQLERDLTGIEIRLLEDFVEIVVRDINEVWKACGDVQFQFDAVEMNPAAIRAFAEPGEAAVIGYTLSLGEMCSGSIVLALPITTLMTPGESSEVSRRPARCRAGPKPRGAGAECPSRWKRS